MSSILVCEPHEFPTFPANNLFNSHKRGRYAPWYDTWSIMGNGNRLANDCRGCYNVNLAPRHYHNIDMNYRGPSQ